MTTQKVICATCGDTILTQPGQNVCYCRKCKTVLQKATDNREPVKCPTCGRFAFFEPGQINAKCKHCKKGVSRLNVAGRRGYAN